MDAQWIRSPTGRRVLEHWADPRPAWLWSADGQALLWRNPAARLFQRRAKAKKSQGTPIAIPIRGQISRLIRLGSMNRSSLSRMQFLVGDKPVSATCACMPLKLADGETGLLIVSVDPIAPELLETIASQDDPGVASLLLPASEYLLLDAAGRVASGTRAALIRYAPVIAGNAVPQTDADGCGTLELDGQSATFVRLKASPQGASLLLFEAPAEAAVPAPATPAPVVAEAMSTEPAEPLLPLGLPPIETSVAPATPADTEDHWIEPLHEPATVAAGLTSLFDRLADAKHLFAPLGAEEDFPRPAAEAVGAPASQLQAQEEAPEAAAPSSPTVAETATVAAPPELAPGEEIAQPEPPAAEEPAQPEADTLLAEKPVLFQVIGRGFVPLGATAVEPPQLESPAPADLTEETAVSAEPAQPAADVPGREQPAPPLPDSESVERVSRYNFDELSRILNDRVGNGEQPGRAGLTPFSRQPLAPMPSATPDGALVTLSGETLVLNRLPLGILVFRDQQVLFANRAITEMTGYPSVESLRAAGLGAIFPAAADETQAAGPVNHLMQRDGMLVPVTARLQSVSWQGKPALMLSASATEVRTGHEAAVRAFAELVADNRGDGFIETTRAGVITAVSGDARQILRRDESQLVGRPISMLTAPADMSALRAFFERPARFAETARPVLTVKGLEPGLEITLFAQGQAGTVSGYFGFVYQTRGPALPVLAAPDGVADPALLGRLSRGVRRPLNTVIGFSDLIGTAAFGTLENERYLEYARDIKTAGLEIAALMDEIDDFARLRDGRYSPRPSDIDLGGLLESSVLRLRSQANAARVLVRSAISERLPRIRADRASLAQAVLNLLASAIDQTPQGGSVVLSAQVDDEGGIVINVRDSALNVADLGERFVVFRDGVGRGGETLGPVRSSVGLALTRALLAVNAMALTVDPAASTGMLFSVTVPPESVVLVALPPAGTP